MPIPPEALATLLAASMTITISRTIVSAPIVWCPEGWKKKVKMLMAPDRGNGGTEPSLINRLGNWVVVTFVKMFSIATGSHGFTSR
jgi:hypothetical protein